MKKVWWALFIIALVLYSALVYSWILEGNRNFEKQRIERQNDGVK